jgi:hypothetical protein
MLKFVFAYLANTAVLCYSLTIICCCQVQDYICWIISTENDHRHHHKFIKYEKRLRKEGKKCSVYQSSKIFATSARVWRLSTSLSSFQRSNSSPTYILHRFHLEDFFHALTRSLLSKIHMLFIVSKQCACSRQVHIEGHVNRFEFLLSCDNNSDNDSLGLFCQKIVSFAA